ncbi:phospholipase [Sphingomonas koreensis]|nr:phospholipase [Sphingomonas koreensis]
MDDKNEEYSTAPFLRPGHNCWRVEEAERFSLIVDANAYFTAARQAMMGAQKRIVLIGWDFDARIQLVDSSKCDGKPVRLGSFLLWLVKHNPELEIFLLRWDMGMLKTLLRGTTLLTLLRWKAHPRITARLDSTHPVNATHHQKIVVVDDAVAFCGGIDMTSGRWDTRRHADREKRRTNGHGRPSKPWHDATCAAAGAAAAALGDVARDRWQAAGGARLDPVQDTHPSWPAVLTEPQRQVALGIARTYPKMKDRDEIREIESLYLDMIASARDVIYAESQYFASRRVALAIARRLREADGPEVIIVMPRHAEGWLEPIAMDNARARLVQAIARADTHDRFRIYHPVTAGGADIYVHAKITIIDDQLLRVGSSNFNNRSLGLDTECDVVLSATDSPGRSVARAIAKARHDLIAEHLGVPVEQLQRRRQEKGSWIAAIETLRGEGRSLIRYAMPELNDVQRGLADSELLDPEEPDEFEPGRRPLLGGLREFLRRA